MSIVSGFQYFKVKFTFPPQNATYSSPAVAFIPKGRYLVLVNTAIVGNMVGISQNFVVNAPVGTGDIFAACPVNNPAITDGAATNVVYRNFTSHIIAPIDNTPIYFQIGLINPSNCSPSTAAQDDLYNYFHFIKIA